MELFPERRRPINKIDGLFSREEEEPGAEEEDEEAAAAVDDDDDALEVLEMEREREKRNVEHFQYPHFLSGYETSQLHSQRNHSELMIAKEREREEEERKKQVGNTHEHVMVIFFFSSLIETTSDRNTQNCT